MSKYPNISGFVGDEVIKRGYLLPAISLVVTSIIWALGNVSVFIPEPVSPRVNKRLSPSEQM